MNLISMMHHDKLNIWDVLRSSISSVSFSRVPRASFPISPQAHPHSIIARKRASSPVLTITHRRIVSSRSLAARCISHACNSDWVCESLEYPVKLVFDENSDLLVSREEVEGCCFARCRFPVLCLCLEALRTRVTLYRG